MKIYSKFLFLAVIFHFCLKIQTSERRIFIYTAVVVFGEIFFYRRFVEEKRLKSTKLLASVVPYPVRIKQIKNTEIARKQSTLTIEQNLALPRYSQSHG